MKQQIPDFKEVMGQFAPMAEQFQSQMQQQIEQFMKQAGGAENPFKSMFSQLPMDPAALASMFGKMPMDAEAMSSMFGKLPMDPSAMAAMFNKLPMDPQALTSMFGQIPMDPQALTGILGQMGNAPMNPAIQPFLSSTMNAIQQAFSQVSVSSLGQLQSEYATEMSALMTSAMNSAPLTGDEQGPKVSLDNWIDGDKRFSSKDWHDHGPFELTAALYSLNSRYTRKLLDLLPENLPERRQVEYALEQMICALSPSNYLATNPEAQKKILETKGESLKVSIENLIGDLTKGKISQTDDTAFEVGVNVATTPGDVVFENRYFQLIQYTPTTEKVGARPMLFVPPCINKYYILDLQPSNSLCAYLVSQGHTLFLVSWKNPQEEDSDFSWNGYVEEGVLTAIDTVCDITRQKQINILGFCVGGTLLATALSTMAGRGDDKIASVTFLTTLLDFSDTGALGVFVTEEQVKAREETIGAGGLMPGKDLAGAFSSLRPNDLIWNYVVNNYLKGEKPPVFDLLYWNGDSTNLPGPMFTWYLRNTYLENNLIDPGRVEVCDIPVDLGQINAPVYILATREDHIVPWTSAYLTSQLVGSENVRFVLGASGHIAGVINPANKNKRNFWVNDDGLGESAEEWFDGATEVPGSWWSDWANWLEEFKGNEVKARVKPGNTKHKAIEPAPGRYVKQKA